MAIQNYKDEVHIEPAMIMGDRFEGHVVQGHIDTIGVVKDISNNGNSFDVFITVDKKFIQYIVPKGSITIDGVSLTVNDVYDDTFRLTIIPHTMKKTLFKNYKKGSMVNIETDMFARYISHILTSRNSTNPLTWEKIDSITALY